MSDLIDRDKLLNSMFADDPKDFFVYIADFPYVDAVEVVRCANCKHRFVDGENVRFNCCELNHNKVQSDDWFCADGERRSE